MPYGNKQLRILKKRMQKMSKYVHYGVKISYLTLCTNRSIFRPELSVPIIK
jgi:hypothetical protein